MSVQEKTIYGDGEVTLTFLNKSDWLNLGSPKATSVHCFVIKNDKVLFTVNPRGIDIIGGHVEPGENSEQALLREAMEEASIIPIKYEVVGAIAVDNSNNPKAIEKGYPLIGYQLFYKVTEFDILPFNATHECTNRKWVNKQEITKTHHKWLKTHQATLNECFNTPAKKLKM